MGWPDSAAKEAGNFQPKVNMRWGFISSENSTSFHSPQEASRVLGRYLQPGGLFEAGLSEQHFFGKGSEFCPRPLAQARLGENRGHQIGRVSVFAQPRNERENIGFVFIRGQVAQESERFGREQCRQFARVHRFNGSRGLGLAGRPAAMPSGD
jgi:hypothetical protein